MDNNTINALYRAIEAINEAIEYIDFDDSLSHDGAVYIANQLITAKLIVEGVYKDE